MDIKQLLADLAATVRGNDILKCEVQNALDALSYATPKLKYLKLQVLKKDKNINQLTNDLQECMKNAQTRQLSHPLPVLRAREIDEWSRSQEYRSLLQRAIQIGAELLLKVGRAFTLAESVCITSTSKAGWHLKRACGYKPEKSDSCVCFDLEWFRSNAIYKQKTPMAEEAHLACGLHM
ncbi:hypothetical protein CQW23_18551 [Capsicum baccatum]|uniref:Uncharacterized protein n=1 Tax=Capsicum baccatum TaxID=33114 RepID=A0A2G2W379_CAPBA|nr:hypothetical protein CQW23_18551 [Capsicum baccatum]